MHITRLRLLGFKSFVEPAELVIERGLTGVVGPNGCGKSNLLEALRWVMGETSYKNMRASSMEDVIFSGTNNRPARNIAEVTIVLDNRDRTAHPAFNEHDNLEITRRIERDSGSDYRINGKSVRARDVQLLFADASTGAHSPALVQQGRIGEIVSAKPAQRRFILEEAAGISGLASRRHEAEIKLRGAEGNLERLLDIIGQLQSRLSSLRRQERQVGRYRDLSRQVERLEILKAYRHYLDFRAQLQEAESEHQNILRQVGEKTTEESGLRQLQMEASQKLPALREREMVSAAILQRLTIESAQLEKEQQEQQKRKDELTARCAQIEADRQREQQNSIEDQKRLEAFKTELVSLEESVKKDPSVRLRAADALTKAETELAEAEEQRTASHQQYAEQKAQREALDRERDEKRALLQKLSDQRIRLAEETASLRRKLDDIADFDLLSAEIKALEEKLTEQEAQWQAAEQELQAAKTTENEALRQKMQDESARQTLRSQIDTLEKLLQGEGQNMQNQLVEKLSVKPGYETALGAALGDELEASLDPQADLHWRSLERASGLDAVLPPNCPPLAQFVTAPEALSPRLQMTGLVEREAGEALQKQLSPGQRLVSIEGDLWRWDGYVARADAPSVAARRLAEKNRLEKLRETYQERAQQAQKSQQLHEQAQTSLAQAEQRQKEGRNAHEQTAKRLEQKRRAMFQAEQQASQYRARLEALGPRKKELIEQHKETSQRLEQIEQEGQGGKELQQLAAQLERLDATILKLRKQYHEAKAFHDGLQREQQVRTKKIKDLHSESKRLVQRLTLATQQDKRLQERLATARAELDSLQDLPDQTRVRRQALNDEVKKAEAQRQEAADQLQQGENTLREIERSLNACQSAVGSVREQAAACAAREEAARARLEEQIELIGRELDCQPDECLPKAGLASADELPPFEKIKADLSRALRDRERLGNVNLRADVEARELAAEIEEMESEHKDLIEAIAALRTAIADLNKEGRRRLLKAFHEINSHFESLFTSLFGGGKARLELVENDDPLQAGLEIIASPPGKKPQVLTLLSGGEKALTALSLIFAVFLTNPAPICVLDEVDAPLDDANVERFCKLLNKMREKTDTRFLVITHHPTSMAHMDQLFGVTMAEKGISQLVSVDLSTAERYVETA